MVKKDILVRVCISIILALLAVTLFIFNTDQSTEVSEELTQEFLRSAQAIDKEVDKILKRFGVRQSWVRREEFADKSFKRVERRVLIPPDIVPAVMNRELNVLARRFHGRAVATENLRENTVTIHIIVQRSVIQTVILKPNPEFQRRQTSDRLKKV